MAMYVNADACRELCKNDSVGNLAIDDDDDDANSDKQADAHKNKQTNKYALMHI